MADLGNGANSVHVQCLVAEVPRLEAVLVILHLQQMVVDLVKAKI